MIQTEVAEKLARWANVGEREAPVAFVGRDAEIALVLGQLATWRQGETPGRTIVAQGPPGAGKTALLREIARRLPERVPGAVAVYRPTPWSRRNVSNVLLTLAERMMAVPAASFRTTMDREGAVGARAVATARLSRSRTTAPPTLSSWDDFETLFAPRAGEAKPTVLLVDEVQRMENEAETKELLYHLHDQTTFPLLLVCGGLSTSAAHLGRLGLSRLNEKCILGVDALTLAQAQRGLEESLGILARDVGGIAGHADRWARRLAPSTHGWPQHVTCHFQAAAQALLQSEVLAFDDASLHRALALAETDMRRYYDRRLETSQTSALIVFGVYEAIHDRAVRRRDAMAIIDAVLAVLDPYDKEDHEARFGRPGECLDQLLYAGVVGYATTSGSSPLSVPIPSMATHVASQLSPLECANVRRAVGLPVHRDIETI